MSKMTPELQEVSKALISDLFKEAQTKVLHQIEEIKEDDLQGYLQDLTNDLLLAATHGRDDLRAMIVNQARVIAEKRRIALSQEAWDYFEFALEQTTRTLAKLIPLIGALHA
jgi:uncharacterized protein (DUF1778 family)